MIYTRRNLERKEGILFGIYFRNVIAVSFWMKCRAMGAREIEGDMLVA